MNKQDEKTRRLVLCAMLAALTCVTTAFLSVPMGILPNAYVHMGDTVIYMAAYLLGPAAGAAVGAIGSACADALLGAYVYALPTLVIKGVLGCTAGWILVRTSGHIACFVRLVLCGAFVIMGYGLYEMVLYGFSAAILGVPLNVVQSVVSALFGTVMIGLMEKTTAVRGGREK